MVLNSIYAHASEDGQRRALVWNGFTLSYGQLAGVIETRRQQWLPLGLPPGQVAIVVAHSLLDNWICVLALQSMGLVTVCVRSLAQAQALALGSVACVVLCSRKASDNQTGLTDWPQAELLPVAADLFRQPVTADPQQSAPFTAGGGHLLYTSGTTGNPKTVLHECASEAQRCAIRAQAENLDSTSVGHVVSLGLWTGLGYRRPLVLWHQGACVVFDQRSQWANHLGNCGETHLSMVSGMLDEALRTTKAHPKSPWSFVLSVGGGFVSPAQAHAVRQQITPHFVLTYASTELWTAVMRSKVETDEDLYWLKPIGTRQVQVVDESDRPCPDGVEGLLRIRLQASDHHGYWNDSQTSARVFRDGWYYPGDMAVRRSDGRFRVLGRLGDVLNIGGSKHACGPLEAQIQQELSAQDVCAFSGPDALGTDRVVIALEAEPAFDAPTLKRLSQRVPLIGQALFVQMPQFPRTQSGTRKIDRVTLRRMVFTAINKHLHAPTAPKNAPDARTFAPQDTPQ